jgi:DNA-binding NarL/FixJ family response regulator
MADTALACIYQPRYQLSAPAYGSLNSSKETPKQSSKSIPFGLTTKEVSVVVVLMLSPGSTYDFVAEKLCVVRDTVKYRLGCVYNKLGVTSQLEALQKLLEDGFVASEYVWTLPIYARKSYLTIKN